PASGVRGNDGVYPSRPSALYTPTGPLGRSVSSVELKQPSMHCRSSDCRLRCARDPVTSSFFRSRVSLLPASDVSRNRISRIQTATPPGKGDGPGGVAARFAMMSSVETAATGFNDSVGRSVGRSLY
ncbi:hypothetical protein THAOC_06121, partial [Thalassiosira oceanica]